MKIMDGKGKTVAGFSHAEDAARCIGAMARQLGYALHTEHVRSGGFVAVDLPKNVVIENNIKEQTVRLVAKP